MPLTPVEKDRATQQSDIQVEIKNNPATLIRGDVLAQHLVDEAESAIYKSDYTPNEVLLFKDNTGTIVALTIQQFFELIPGYGLNKVLTTDPGTGAVTWNDF